MFGSPHQNQLMQYSMIFFTLQRLFIRDLFCRLCDVQIRLPGAKVKRCRHFFHLYTTQDLKEQFLDCLFIRYLNAVRFHCTNKKGTALLVTNGSVKPPRELPLANKTIPFLIVTDFLVIFKDYTFSIYQAIFYVNSPIYLVRQPCFGLPGNIANGLILILFQQIRKLCQVFFFRKVTFLIKSYI